MDRELSHLCATYCWMVSLELENCRRAVEVQLLLGFDVACPD